jgi:hypothetical protein
MPDPVLIIRGENRLLSRSLRLNDGVTPLPVSSLARAAVQLMQAGKVKFTYVAGTNPELRAGAAADELVLELTSAVSLALKPGPVTLRWDLWVADADFLVEPALFKDLQDEIPWSIVP